jgi:glycosyltransferase involved in cell wall biosynthesis
LETRLTPVLMVTGDFVPTGGMDMPNLALAAELAARGHAVHLVAHRVDVALAESPNVTVHRVARPAGSRFLAAPLLRYHGERHAAAVMAAGGRVIVNGGNCQWGDVNWVHYVHAAHRPETAGVAGRAWAALRHRVFLSEERSALRRARVVIANSQRTKRDLVERLGIPAERIHVVYYGIDATRFAPVSAAVRRDRREALGWPTDRPVAAFIGALGDRRKGFDTLFAAWLRLCADSTWDADLAVIGAGAELERWRALAAASPAAGRFRFLGFRQDVPDILPAADVLVAPTRYEAYGQGVAEALCCGLPAIVSADAGVAERYPEGFGDLLLSDPADADALTARLRSWRSRRDEWSARCVPVSERLRRHDWAAMTRTVAEAIRL